MLGAIDLSLYLTHFPLLMYILFAIRGPQNSEDLHCFYDISFPDKCNDYWKDRLRAPPRPRAEPQVAQGGSSSAQVLTMSRST